MADLLELSARIIDAGHADEPVNRVTQELSEVADDLAMIESFSHVVLLRTDGGLVAFDTSGAHTGAACVESLRGWSADPVSHLVYTHGHVDHVGGTAVELHHARGETDDHTWAWLPEQRALAVGDFLIWNFPNAGNPQKVQRYPEEWARALRAMAAMEPELLLPAHGLPIGGKDRIAMVLDEVATALEVLVAAVLERMNAGARLDEIVHEVRVPDAVLARPFLRPLYDEPEFVVRNVWRRYGGWWDGDPSTLKPAPAQRLAAEMAALAGGALALAQRADELASSGELRLACHLAEQAGLAAPEDHAVQTIRADVYERRRKAETSLMAKGIFASAVRESKEALGEG